MICQHCGDQVFDQRWELEEHEDDCREEMRIDQAQRAYDRGIIGQESTGAWFAEDIEEYVA